MSSASAAAFRLSLRSRGVADRSRWFHREYFRPSLPGWFMEIKSRTWSPRDAEKKAALISELLALLQIGPNQVTRTEYVEI